MSMVTLSDKDEEMLCDLNKRIAAIYKATYEGNNKTALLEMLSFINNQLK